VQTSPNAWRILRHDVCDGCSLGPAGFRDATLKGIHLCMTRQLLRLNTMLGLDHARLANVEGLRCLSNYDLRKLGRLAYPILRRRGEPGFRRVSWQQATECVASYLRHCAPQRFAIFNTSRGLQRVPCYLNLARWWFCCPVRRATNKPALARSPAPSAASAFHYNVQVGVEPAGEH
jgi:hypothetical protein